MLHLAGPLVTDAGLTHVKKLKGLTLLDLESTKVTDAGLAHLQGTQSLTTLYVTDRR